MDNQLDNNFKNDIADQARPQFLTVLCILTWVAVGFMVIFSIIGIFTKPSPEKQAEQIEQIRNFDPVMAENMEAALEEQEGSVQVIGQILNFIALFLTAFGTWWMWNLKKQGFYLYLAGELLPYLSMLFGGKALMSMMGGSGAMGAIFGVVIAMMVIFDLAFIIMYAMNLKYMSANKAV